MTHLGMFLVPFRNRKGLADDSYESFGKFAYVYLMFMHSVQVISYLLVCKVIWVMFQVNEESQVRTVGIICFMVIVDYIVSLYHMEDATDNLHTSKKWKKR